MPRPLPRNRDELLEALDLKERLASAEIDALVDRVAVIRQARAALASGVPIEACHLEELEPEDFA